HLAGNRCRRVAAVAQVQKVATQSLAVDGCESEPAAAFAGSLDVEIIGELQQVVAVRRDGIRRVTVLGLQVLEEGLGALLHDLCISRLPRRGGAAGSARRA